MHIVVCINHIPDPEAPAKTFALDESTNRPALSKTSRVIGPFDENAIELALKLKDATGAKLTALTLGPATNVDALRKALATRADEAVHVKEDRAIELDSAAVATILAAAVRRLGDVDLVMSGRQVGDWDGGQVGQLLAEELDLPCIALASQIGMEGDRSIRVTREVPGGMAVVEADLPLVVTATNGPEGQLRIPKVKDVMAAHRAPITTWSAADLGLDIDRLAAQPTVSIQRLFLPQSGAQVELIRADSDDEIATELAKRIIGMKVV